MKDKGQSSQKVTQKRTEKMQVAEENFQNSNKDRQRYRTYSLPKLKIEWYSKKEQSDKIKELKEFETKITEMENFLK